MNLLRRLLIAAATACTSLALTAAPSLAIVGGHDAAPGAYPSIAEITFGPRFLCTGTLIAPTTACSPPGTAARSPAPPSPRRPRWPARADRRAHRLQQARPGREGPGLARRSSSPTTSPRSGYDITLLQLASAVDQGADQGRRRRRGQPVDAGHDRRRSSAGARPPRAATRPTRCRRRRSRSPPTPTARGAYSDFDADDDGLRRLPAGRHRHLPGRLRRPAVRPHAAGALKVVGATSFGEGCARPGKPGVYARVADTPLREWIRSQAPAGVD